MFDVIFARRHMRFFIAVIACVVTARAHADFNRSCDGEVFAQYGKDTVTLMRPIAWARDDTRNEARRLARDKITQCAEDHWHMRWVMLGREWVRDLPLSCQGLGLYSWDVDIKKRIVASACAVWSEDIREKFEIPLSVHVRTKGAEGCGNNNDLHRTRTLSKNYKLTQQMCITGY